MKKILTLLFTTLFFVLLAQAQQGQLKIGYVNSDTVIKELPEAKDAQAKLEKMVKAFQDEIEKRSKALQEKADAFQKQSQMLNEATKQAKVKEITEEEQSIYTYRQEKQQELAMQRDKVMKPIQEKVYQAIAKVAKEQKLSFVFDKANDVPVLYADPQYDYTFKVLDLLKRGGK